MAIPDLPPRYGTPTDSAILQARAVGSALRKFSSLARSGVLQGFNCNPAGSLAVDFPRAYWRDDDPIGPQAMLPDISPIAHRRCRNNGSSGPTSN